MMSLWPLLALAVQGAGGDGPDYMAAATKVFAPVARCERASARDESTESIVVCGRRGGTEPYRLPIRPDGFDPKGGIVSVSRERHRLIQEGDAGTGSCSTVGPGGWTGCFHRNTKRRCEQDPCGMAF
jgi:hypothetical protein